MNSPHILPLSQLSYEIHHLSAKPACFVPLHLIEEMPKAKKIILTDYQNPETQREKNMKPWVRSGLTLFLQKKMLFKNNALLAASPAMKK